MSRAENTRGGAVALTVLAPPELYQRLNALRDETGVPITRFAIRAIKRALDERDALGSPGKSRSRKGPVAGK